MSANQEMKKEIVAEIVEKIKKAQSVVLIEYKGLNVEQDTEFRNRFRANNVDYKVYKNRLLKIAFEELGIKFDSSIYDGTTALATSNDVLAPAKLVIKGETDYKVVKAKAGYVEGKIVDYSFIKSLATIPDKEVLIAQLLGMLINPIRSLAVVLNEAAKKQEA